ncbi:MAG TPA: hypothetical protein VJ953_14050 [Saprospiraceae bacterium]|nr:hypothetical protein [Saprospiraceae bacterium]
MKRILLWIGISVLILITGLFIAGLIIHEPRPKAEPDSAADALAEKMLDALNETAWDSTRYVTWTFRGINEYVWDREANLVEVSNGDTRVVIHTKSLEYQVLKPRDEEDKHYQYFETAWANFCNDAYWLCAPYKVFDPGTKRAIVEDESGRPQLLVTYESGGVTPGDAYLWQLDKDYRPESFEMWVSIIPIGGLKASWSDWQTLESGALIAGKRMLLDRVEIPITEVRGGRDWKDIGLEEDPFANFDWEPGER